MRKGAQTLVFESKPVILSRAAIGGKKEGEGPLAAHFDFLGKDAKLGQKTFEKAESKLQELALDTAKRKLGISYEDIDVLFAGDLLNQCISSSFAARGTSIPFLGLYGACSTMAESLLLAAAFVDAGFADTADSVRRLPNGPSPALAAALWEKAGTGRALRPRPSEKFRITASRTPTTWARPWHPQPSTQCRHISATCGGYRRTTI